MRISIGSLVLAAGSLLVSSQAIAADDQITDTAFDAKWGANNPTTYDGRVLWFLSVNGDARDVHYYDGTTSALIQAHDPNIASLGLLLDTVFGLGSGAAPGEVMGAWRRGADFAWVWTSGQAPVEIDTVGANLFDTPENPLPTNPEGVAIADGCVFMIMQANAGGVIPNHVFRIDPATGDTETVSGSARVDGVDEVRTSQCEAVWVFDRNSDTVSGLPPELQHYDGTTTATLDSGPINRAEIAFHEGKVVYIKDVRGIPQVFLIDLAQSSPAPQQLSGSLRLKRNPQIDGRHVAWAELDTAGDTSADIVLLGDHTVTLGEERAHLQGPFPFWLDHGQLVWRTPDVGLRTRVNNEVLASEPDLDVHHPRVSLGKIAWYGQPAGDDDDFEIFLNLDSSPELGQPSPPMFLEAEPGNGRVTLRWDRVLGATSYNVYYAEEPGVSPTNYASRLGGAKLEDVQSPLLVSTLDNSKSYYFIVTTVEGTTEGPGSGETTTTESFIVDSTADEPDADNNDGLCQSLTGPCTLRAAVEQAGSLDRDITVVVPAGTYSLTQDLTRLLANGHMRLVGDGQGVTVIEGAPGAPVMVTSLGSGRLRISDLTLKNGDQGIESYFDLTLERVTVEDNGSETTFNLGGGVYGAGLTTTLIDCVIANNETGSHGGGLTFSGGESPKVKIVRTEIRDNIAGIGGGGFYNLRADTFVIDSAIHHNSSRSLQNWPGGGIFNQSKLTVVGSAIYANDSPDEGGGLYCSSHDTVIINSTISENHADALGGGVAVNNGVLWLNNVTLSNNAADLGGANFAGRSLAESHFKHSLFYSADNANNCVFDAPDFPSEGYNLENGDSCRLEGADLTNTNPLLGPLSDNGGPTPTHALLAGSPAIDAGDPAGCYGPFGLPIRVDQRGAARPIDGDQSGGPQCDIGAFEEQGPCRDADGDGISAVAAPSCEPPGIADCDDSNGSVWATPGEVRDLMFTDPDTLAWGPPDELGGESDALLYGAIRTNSPADLSVGAVCLAGAQTEHTTTDTNDPSLGQAFYYLARAMNACPAGLGTWGTTSSGVDRVSSVCP